MHRFRRGLLAAAIAAALLIGLAALGYRVRSDTVAGAGLPQMVQRWRDRAGVPAVTLAVDAPGRPVVLTASGTGLRDGGPEITVDAQFRVASITKVFVATVVLQLAEEGRLRLDDPLARYMPSFPGADRITLRQLLNHTSGVPDFELADHFGEGLLAHRQRRWRTDEILALAAKARPDFAPGSHYRYSNTGYVLLGEVIGAVTGSSWAAEVRRRIIDPLHLEHTYVAGAEPVPGGVLPGYFDTDNDGDEENIETGRPWPAQETAEGAAGAIVSTAGDLAVFGGALFRGRLLAAPSLRQMLTEGPHHPRNSNYGLGVEISRPDYRTTVSGHGGALPGFRSTLWYVPQRDTVIVVLTNDWRANPQDLAELALRRHLRRSGPGVPQLAVTRH
jgi:D-alanyl-D-alanine carboxypeptidase